jgi:hypothetical protein
MNKESFREHSKRALPLRGSVHQSIEVTAFITTDEPATRLPETMRERPVAVCRTRLGLRRSAYFELNEVSATVATHKIARAFMAQVPANPVCEPRRDMGPSAAQPFMR